MNSKIFKLLWVDNDLYEDLNELRIALLLNDEFEADFALNATEGFNLLRQKAYDIAVIDLRMPPGRHDDWKKYEVNGSEQYGYALLKEVTEQRNPLFPHLEKTRFCVYSIENPKDVPQLFEPPIALPHEHYCQKTDRVSSDDFLNFLKGLLRL